VEVAAATVAGGGGCWASPLLARVRTRVAFGGDGRVETRLGDVSMYPS
jgi:hypothetical protein